MGSNVNFTGSEIIPINDLKRSENISDETKHVIERVLTSGHWVHGPEHTLFEREFAEFLEIKHAIGVGSGTDAIEIALRALGCQRGSTIINVANAGGYTTIAAKAIGCQVIFCDIKLDDLLIDFESLSNLISRDISAVVVTHLFGNVAEIDKIAELCREFDVPLIEDCAQAIGASSGGKMVGTFGDVATFSFYPTKNLGCVGDGGAVVTNDPTLASKIKSIRQYGWSTKYDIQLEGGMNSRLDEMQAAILRIGLRNLNKDNERRRQIIAEYRLALQDSEIRLATTGGDGTSPHLAVLLLPPGIERERYRQYLAVLGISTDVHYPILDNHQEGFSVNGSFNPLEISESVSSQIVTIPLFPGLSDLEISRIVSAIPSFESKIY
jgi:dTDP-4-amino-4,6-dideoxygalactose transaminase